MQDGQTGVSVLYAESSKVCTTLCTNAVMSFDSSQIRQQLCPSCRNFGEFWLLKLILSEMQRDLCHRLSVHAKPRQDAKSGNQDTLLFNSQLWRMLEVSVQFMLPRLAVTKMGPCMDKLG